MEHLSEITWLQREIQCLLQAYEILVFIGSTRTEGSGEIAHMRSLAQPSLLAYLGF